MKILIVGNDPSVKGGITSVISQLRSYDWQKENIEMRFIPTYIDKSTVHKILFFMMNYCKILFSFIIFRPDAMHMHMSYKGSFQRAYLLHKLCRVFHIKDIIHLHGSEFKQWYDSTNSITQKKIRKLLRECNVMIVLGNEWERRIFEIEPKTNIAVANNTVTIPSQVTNWNRNTFQILYLGVLIQRKGVHDLLDSVSILKKNGKLNNAQFVIAGTGEEEQKLKKKCSVLDLEDVIRFNGWTHGEQKWQLMLESQLLVLPSYNEGLPMAVLEAMSYGLPIVASDVGDMSAAVQEGVNGYLISPGNPDQISEAINKILSKKQSEWTSLSTMSRIIAEEKFSDSNYMASFLNIYRNFEDVDAK